MRQLTKTHRWALIWWFLTWAALFFFLIIGARFLTTWSVMKLTCVPPLEVAIELTNETCWKPLVLTVTHTSHRSCSPTASTTGKSLSLLARTMLTYCRNDRIGMALPLKDTLTPRVTPAMSYTRRVMSATMSASSLSIPNLARSGEKLILVQSAVFPALIFCLPWPLDMLSVNTCLYVLPDFESAVSTVNFVEKMLANLAP
mmetsp:Transcript_32548/g.98138  ORF Transcript_32548/g.98138 Transcript_32548/m.98138 type:complete len:201 (-) Transcript_32548:504-1106(-)